MNQDQLREAMAEMRQKAVSLQQALDYANEALARPLGLTSPSA